jgi:nitrogen regulatory protein PII
MQRYKTITCIIPTGHALELLERLRTEHGVTSAYAHHARDVASHALHATGRGQTIADESEVVTVLVAEEDADRLFEQLYEMAGIGQPDGGLIFMERMLAARASAAPEA